MTALVTYASTHGSYPPTLAALNSPTPGSDSDPTAVDLIDPALAAGHKIEYTFIYKPASSRSDGKYDLFTITADPDSEANGVFLHYFVDQTDVIRIEKTGKATKTSAPFIG